MPLNYVKKGSNMYQFCNATWNPIKGYCSHQCNYCYYQNNPRFKSNIGELRLDEKELKTNLGEDNFIFVGSSCDMFADNIPQPWIERVISYCNEYPNNTYLFQTKDPHNFFRVQELFMKNTILGTTIETNRKTPSKAPHTNYRRNAMENMYNRKMITIEPIMDFDLEILVDWIRKVNPEFVNIGADSQKHGLKEPSWDKIQKLIKELEKFTKVNLKENLRRLKVNPKTS